MAKARKSSGKSARKGGGAKKAAARRSTGRKTARKGTAKKSSRKTAKKASKRSDQEGCQDDRQNSRAPRASAKGCGPQGTCTQGGPGSHGGSRAQDRRNKEPAGTQRPRAPGGGRSGHHGGHGTRERGDGSRNPAARQREIRAPADAVGVSDAGCRMQNAGCHSRIGHPAPPSGIRHPASQSAIRHPAAATPALTSRPHHPRAWVRPHPTWNGTVRGAGTSRPASGASRPGRATRPSRSSALACCLRQPTRPACDRCAAAHVWHSGSSCLR